MIVLIVLHNGKYAMIAKLKSIYTEVAWKKYQHIQNGIKEVGFMNWEENHDNLKNTGYRVLNRLLRCCYHAFCDKGKGG